MATRKKKRRPKVHCAGQFKPGGGRYKRGPCAKARCKGQLAGSTKSGRPKRRRTSACISPRRRAASKRHTTKRRRAVAKVHRKGQRWTAATVRHWNAHHWQKPRYVSGPKMGRLKPKGRPHAMVHRPKRGPVILIADTGHTINGRRPKRQRAVLVTDTGRTINEQVVTVRRGDHPGFMSDMAHRPVLIEMAKPKRARKRVRIG